ncbi:MAG: hypothetical protein ACI4IE_02060, partial [Eubacterium sp.]
KRFDSIVNLSYFTTAQVRNLCGAYYLEKFGTDKLRRLELIEKGLTGGIKDDLCKAYIPEENPIKDGVSYYSGRKDILSVIHYIVNDSANRTLISNFKFSDTQINRIVYQACKSKHIDSFFHYVNSVNGDSGANIETMFNTIHYAEIGYITHYYDKSANEIMPYFIMTDNYGIQYDENAENAFLIKTGAQTNNKIINGKIDEIKNNASVSVTINSDAFAHLMQLQSLYVSYSHNNIMGFDNIFCPNNITREIIEAIATPAIKNVPIVVNKLLEHYNMIFANENSNVDSLIVNFNAVNRFVKTGRIESFPTELAGPVPKKLRAQMIKPLLENEKGYLLTNPNTYKSNYNMAMEIHNNTIIFVSCEDYETEFIGKVCYYTDREETVNDFKDYLAYLTASEKTYSEENTKKLLKSFLIELESE